LLTDYEVRQLTLRLFTQKSERDLQRKVGASQISDPCTYHLAQALISSKEEYVKYWLGGKLGTATHMYLEDAIERADLEQFPELTGAKVEEKIFLGEIEGYGKINSKPDLVLIEHNHLIDWKTSTRDKSRKLQKMIDDPSGKDSGSAYTIKKYVAQTQLYAWGLNRSGTRIDNLSLVFINRDGTTEADVWSHTFEYSEEFAQSMWDRLVNVWSALQESGDLELFDRDPECFKCRVGI